MPNDYYSPSGWPSTGAQAASADARAEMVLIEAMGNKLPDLTAVGNRIVHVNAGSTALITTSGFTFDGTTLTAPAIASNGAVTVTSTSAAALTVGRQGATDPVFKVNANTASVATGISITGAAAAGGVALAAISSGTNENLTIDAKGSGTITLGGTSTGAITLTRETTMSAALTYGGVTLSNAVTGTGNMVLATSPELTTPTLGVATATSINKVAITAPATSATLTIADGKTLTASNSLTLAGTDGKTLTVSNSLTLAGTDGTTMTFPDTTGTVSTLNKAQTFTAQQSFNAGIASLGSGMFSSANSSGFTIAGGGSNSDGGRIEFYGSTHATYPNQLRPVATAINWTGTQNSIFALSIVNTNTGASAYSNIYLGDSVSATAGILAIVGSGNSSYGGARSMLLGTAGAFPVVVIANNTEVARFASGGLITMANALAADTSVTPGTLSQTGMRLMANTTNGAVLHGYGATYDVQLTDRSGTASLSVINAQGVFINGSLLVGSPTGGAQGNGTINAVAVYDDGVILTDWVFDLHYDGKPKADDKFYRGQSLFSLGETALFTEEHRHLPWMPTRAAFENERSLGGIVTRLWQGQEQQQLYLFDHEARLKALEQNAQ